MFLFNHIYSFQFILGFSVIIFTTLILYCYNNFINMSCRICSYKVDYVNINAKNIIQIINKLKNQYQDNNRLIPYTLNECLNDNTFHCSAGTQYRDFLFVDDLIKAIFKCFKNNKSIGEIINIGSGKPLNVKWVILFIKNKINLGKPIFGKISFRRDEIFRLYPNIAKAKKILNWKPITSFQNGIRIII